MAKRAEPSGAPSSSPGPARFGNEPGFPPSRDLRKASVAALHEFSERLTAITDYPATARCLSETNVTAGGVWLGHTEILEKAFWPKSSRRTRQIKPLHPHRRRSRVCPLPQRPFRVSASRLLPVAHLTSCRMSSLPPPRPPLGSNEGHSDNGIAEVYGVYEIIIQT